MEIIIKIKVGDWVNDNLDNMVNNQLLPQIIDADGCIILKRKI